jgi:hypothetical protein
MHAVHVLSLWLVVLLGGGGFAPPEPTLDPALLINWFSLSLSQRNCRSGLGWVLTAQLDRMLPGCYRRHCLHH